jgi:hypothetical protein
MEDVMDGECGWHGGKKMLLAFLGKPGGKNH